MKPVIKLYAGLITVCCMLFAGSLYAAKPAGIPMCHYDDDTNEYKLKSVNPKAKDAHLGHGDLLPGMDNGDGNESVDDDCFLVLPETLLAIAYINVDQVAGYHSEADFPIVEIYNADSDPRITAGDKVKFGHYPLGADPEGIFNAGVGDGVGEFDIVDATVQNSVVNITASGDLETIYLIHPDLTSLNLYNNSGMEAVYMEGPYDSASIEDFISDISDVGSFISVPLSLGQPSVFAYILSVGDDYYLDIEVY